MKKAWLLGFFFSVLMVGFAYGQNQSDRSVGQDLQQLRKDYQAKVDKDLKGIGRQIRHLKHQAAHAEMKAKADLDLEIKKLEVQKRDADRKFSDLKKSTGEAWKDLRQGMDDAVSNLKTAADDAVERFKN
jgi:hypothetical protein